MFDTPWVVLPQIDPACVSVGAWPIGERMKRVLTDMLAHYMSLQLEYMAETGDVVVALWTAPTPGATTPCTGVEEHDVPALLILMTELDMRTLPAPALSVQATRLGAGLAAGLSVDYAVVDTWAVCRFMEV